MQGILHYHVYVAQVSKVLLVVVVNTCISMVLAVLCRQTFCTTNKALPFN